MRFDIFENGEKINHIIADEDFCKKYCHENGYTYKFVDPEITPEESLEVSPMEQLRADIDYLALMTGVEL